MDKWVVIAVHGGFYIFVRLINEDADGTTWPGYIALDKASMFGGFEGNKGCPGVCRGDKAAKVTLDRFEPDQVQLFPINNVFAIFSSIDLHNFKGATFR